MVLFFGRLVHDALMGAKLNRLWHHADHFMDEHPDFCYHPYQGKGPAFVVETVQTVYF